MILRIFNIYMISAQLKLATKQGTNPGRGGGSDRSRAADEMLIYTPRTVPLMAPG